MKKFIIAGIVALTAVGGFLIVSNKSDKKDDNNTAAPTSASEKKTGSKKACELLTLEDAKTLIGEGAVVVVEASGSTNLATTDSVFVDNCTYSADGATLGDLKQLTIQVQSGDSGQVKQAYENNKKEFPGDVLPGLGDTAYYATEAKHVNALKNDAWVFVFGGSINAGDEANKELAIKAAQLALNRL